MSISSKSYTLSITCHYPLLYEFTSSDYSVKVEGGRMTSPPTTTINLSTQFEAGLSVQEIFQFDGNTLKSADSTPGIIYATGDGLRKESAPSRPALFVFNGNKGEWSPVGEGPALCESGGGSLSWNELKECEEE